MAVNTSTFKRTAGQDQGGARKPNYYDYSKVLLKARQTVIQVTSFRTFKDDKYGKPQYGNLKIRANHVVVLPNWERGIEGTAAEQEALRLAGHGKPLSMEFNPVVSPPGINRSTGEATKPSGLYEYLRIAVNDGEPLSDLQMGRDLVPARGNPNAEQKAALRSWMEAFNAAITGDQSALDAFLAEYPHGLVPNYEGVIEEEPVESVEDAMVRYPGFRLAQMLNQLEQTKAQFYVTPSIKVRPDGSKYNRLTGLSALVPDDERLETYRPFPKPRDPREDNDDPDVVCSVSGERIRGWETREDGWLTNVAWAEKQEENLGAGFVLRYQGRRYSPPFSPKFYAMAKAQKEAAADQDEDEGDDIPF